MIYLILGFNGLSYRTPNKFVWGFPPREADSTVATVISKLVITERVDAVDVHVLSESDS